MLNIYIWHGTKVIIMSRKATLGFNTYDNKQFQNVLHIGRPRTNKGRIMAERRSEGSEGEDNWTTTYGCQHARYLFRVNQHLNSSRG